MKNFRKPHICIYTYILLKLMVPADIIELLITKSHCQWGKLSTVSMFQALSGSCPSQTLRGKYRVMLIFSNLSTFWYRKSCGCTRIGSCSTYFLSLHIGFIVMGQYIRIQDRDDNPEIQTKMGYRDAVGNGQNICFPGIEIWLHVPRCVSMLISKVKHQQTSEAQHVPYINICSQLKVKWNKLGTHYFL